MSWIYNVALVLGALTAVNLGYRLIRFVHMYFIHQSTISRYLHPQENAYALITGASDGIGLSTTRVLLRRGFNVIVHGRNPEKLARIQSQLAEAFPDRSIMTVAAPADDPVPSVAKIASLIDKLPKFGGRLTVLINNVGGGSTTNASGTSPYTELADMTGDAVLRVMTLNATFPTLLTNALLPTIKKNQPGLIVNIGSYAGVHGFPWISIYSPSKAFNHTFSKALSKEMRATGTDVEVLGIVVGSVKTPGNPRETLNFLVLSPDEMAQDIISRVGCGKDLVVGSWRQSLATSVVTWLPDFVAGHILSSEIKRRAEEETKDL